ncbi:MAG: ATP-binding protein [Aquabacterium sp.]|nr:ATP-binding protein [Aquabacterium sp.]
MPSTCTRAWAITALEARNGGEQAVLQRLRSDAPMCAKSHLVVLRADGSVLSADPLSDMLQQSRHQRSHAFQVNTPGVASGMLQARYTMDFTRSAELGKRWALILMAVSVAAGVVVAVGAGWFVRRKRRDRGGAVARTQPQALRETLLSNLLGNATRFATPGSTVVIAIAPAADAEQVQVVVQNRGEVIAADHLPRLFDRFFRVDSARNCGDAQHHGLGLAIVAAIAHMHAGRTLAESSSGTTRVGFTLAT